MKSHTGTIGIIFYAIEHLELRTKRGKLIRALPIRAITAELGSPVICIASR